MAQISHDWNDGLMLINTKDRERNLEGSPYYENDNFREGIVRIAERAPLNVWLRYDVMNEVMEIKIEASSSEKYRLPLEDDVIYQIGAKKYRASRIFYEGSTYFGYFTEYYDGLNIKLIGKPKIEISSSSQPSTGYASPSDKILIGEDYFVVWENGDTEKIRLRHRDIKRLFDTNRAQDYLEEHRIRSLEDFTTFIMFYDKSSKNGS